MVVTSTHRLSRIFRHLTKKWQLICQHSYELCLLSTERTSVKIYEHTCEEKTVKELGDCRNDLIYVEYEWKQYESSNELIINESESVQISGSEDNTFLSDQLQPLKFEDSLLIPDFQNDSFLSSSSENPVIDLGRDFDNSYFGMNLPILDDSFGLL